MKWVGISGSWQLTNDQIEKDVRKTVREAIQTGHGVVTGGALNVDYFAADEVMKLDHALTHLKIFLPVTLNLYASHYRKRAEEGVITQEQAESLIRQLSAIKKINPHAVIDNMQNTLVNRQTYFERNGAVIEHSDALYAFQVNKSAGVQDTVGKAYAKGIPVTLFSYTVAK